MKLMQRSVSRTHSSTVIYTLIFVHQGGVWGAGGKTSNPGKCACHSVKENYINAKMGNLKCNTNFFGN